MKAGYPLDRSDPTLNCQSFTSSALSPYSSFAVEGVLVLTSRSGRALTRSSVILQRPNVSSSWPNLHGGFRCMDLGVRDVHVSSSFLGPFQARGPHFFHISKHKLPSSLSEVFLRCRRHPRPKHWTLHRIALPSMEKRVHYRLEPTLIHVLKEILHRLLSRRIRWGIQHRGTRLQPRPPPR